MLQSEMRSEFHSEIFKIQNTVPVSRFKKIEMKYLGEFSDSMQRT